MIRALGPTSIVVAVLAVPLIYVPGAESPFADPKLGLLLVAGSLGLAAAMLAWARGESRRGSTALRAAVAAVLLTSLLAAAVAAARGAPGAPYAPAEIIRLLAMIGVAAAAAQAARETRWRRRLFEGVHIAAGVVAVLGLLQHVGLLPFSLPVINVPGSTFGNRNMAAEAIAMALPFGLACVWSAAPERSKGVRLPSRFLLFAGLLLVALVYLAATRARGAWIGGLLGVGTFLAIRRPALSRAQRFLLIPVVGALAVAAVLPGRWRAADALDAKRYDPGTRVVREAFDPASPVARTRLGLWRRTVALYRDHPLAGVGPGNFSVVFPLYAQPGAAADGVMSDLMFPRRPHNELLERLAETGPLGLAAFGALFVTAFAAAWAARRAARGAGEATGDTVTDADAASAGAGSVAACLGCGLTAFPLAMPATALLFGVSLGVLDALAPPPAGEGAGSPRPRPRAATALAAALAALLVAGAGWLSFGVVASAHWRGRAKSAMRLGVPRPPDPGLALAALERAAGATRLDGVRFDIALRTAQVALDAGKGREAYQAANRALALEPSSPHALAARAAAQLTGGQLDVRGAAADAERALQLFPELSLARAARDKAKTLTGPVGRLEGAGPAPVSAGP